MVPSPKAFDIPAHTKIIHDVLAEWKNGERSFLFLGNQGTGKNKITDRICEIGNWEREYIQLHRDSTIGQLTLTPQLEDGKIVWNDSPLIRAVRDGCILVVDEADKAPVEVISVLKGLVEDGELLLADGRRVSKYKDHCSGTILMHPEFSLW
jgi:MoxR-like ATPase